MGTMSSILDRLHGAYATHPHRVGRPHGSRIKVYWTRYLAWRAKQRSRAHLETMSSRQLRDIGITRAQAEHEAAKRPKFWI